MADSSETDERRRSKIPKLRFRQAVSRVQKEKWAEPSEIQAQPRPRRSSIPRLVTKSAEPAKPREEEHKTTDEDEFDKIYGEIVDSPVDDVNILNSRIEDADKVDDNFKELIHAYEKQQVDKSKQSKIPKLRKKSESDIETTKTNFKNETHSKPSTFKTKVKDLISKQSEITKESKQTVPAKVGILKKSHENVKTDNKVNKVSETCTVHKKEIHTPLVKSYNKNPPERTIEQKNTDVAFVILTSEEHGVFRVESKGTVPLMETKRNNVKTVKYNDAPEYHKVDVNELEENEADAGPVILTSEEHGVFRVNRASDASVDLIQKEQSKELTVTTIIEQYSKGTVCDEITPALVAVGENGVVFVDSSSSVPAEHQIKDLKQNAYTLDVSPANEQYEETTPIENVIEQASISEENLAKTLDEIVSDTENDAPEYHKVDVNEFDENTADVAPVILTSEEHGVFRVASEASVDIIEKELNKEFTVKEVTPIIAKVIEQDSKGTVCDEITPALVTVGENGVVFVDSSSNIPAEHQIKELKQNAYTLDVSPANEQYEETTPIENVIEQVLISEENLAKTLDEIASDTENDAPEYHKVDVNEFDENTADVAPVILTSEEHGVFRVASEASVDIIEKEQNKEFTVKEVTPIIEKVLEQDSKGTVCDEITPALVAVGENGVVFVDFSSDVPAEHQIKELKQNAYTLDVSPANEQYEETTPIENVIEQASISEENLAKTLDEIASDTENDAPEYHKVDVNEFDENTADVAPVILTSEEHGVFRVASEASVDIIEKEQNKEFTVKEVTPIIEKVLEQDSKGTVCDEITPALVAVGENGVVFVDSSSDVPAEHQIKELKQNAYTLDVSPAYEQYEETTPIENVIEQVLISEENLAKTLDEIASDTENDAPEYHKVDVNEFDENTADVAPVILTSEEHGVFRVASEASVDIIEKEQNKEFTVKEVTPIIEKVLEQDSKGTVCDEITPALVAVGENGVVFVDSSSDVPAEHQIKELKQNAYTLDVSPANEQYEETTPIENVIEQASISEENLAKTLDEIASDTENDAPEYHKVDVNEFDENTADVAPVILTSEEHGVFRVASEASVDIIEKEQNKEFTVKEVTPIIEKVLEQDSKGTVCDEITPALVAVGENGVVFVDSSSDVPAEHQIKELKQNAYTLDVSPAYEQYEETTPIENVIEQVLISEENLAKTLDEIASDTENDAPEYHKVDVNEFDENTADVAPVILTSEEHGVFRVASEASVDIIEKEQNKEFTVKEVTPIIEKVLEQDSKGTVCDEITPALVAVGENGVVFVDFSSDVPAEHQIKELKQNAYTLDVSPANEQYEETTPIENVIEQASISEENLAKTLDEIASDTENDAPEYHKVDVNEFDENTADVAPVILTSEEHGVFRVASEASVDIIEKEQNKEFTVKEVTPIIEKVLEQDSKGTVCDEITPALVAVGENGVVFVDSSSDVPAEHQIKELKQNAYTLDVSPAYEQYEETTPIENVIEQVLISEENLAKTLDEIASDTENDAPEYHKVDVNEFDENTADVAPVILTSEEHGVFRVASEASVDIIEKEQNKEFTVKEVTPIIEKVLEQDSKGTVCDEITPALVAVGENGVVFVDSSSDVPAEHQIKELKENAYTLDVSPANEQYEETTPIKNVIEQASISEENLAKTLDEIASDTENYAPEYHKVDVNEFYENAADVAPVILTSEEHGVFRVASEASVDVIEKEQNKEFTVKEVTPIIEKNLEQDSKGTVCDEITPALVAVGENGVVFVDSSSDVPAEHQIKELKENAYTLDVSPANEQYEETTPIKNVIEQASISEENLAKTLDEIASDTENYAPEYHKVDVNEFYENASDVAPVILTSEEHGVFRVASEASVDVIEKEQNKEFTVKEVTPIIEKNLEQDSKGTVCDEITPALVAVGENGVVFVDSSSDVPAEHQIKELKQNAYTLDVSPANEQYEETTPIENVIEQASISEENLAKTLDEIASDTENDAPEYHKVDVNEFYENAADVAPVILTSEEHGVFRVASEASVDVIEKEQNKEFTVKEVTPIIEKNLEQDSKGTVCDEITPALVAVGENGVVFVDSSSDVPAEHQIKELKENAYTLDVSPANEQYEETTPIKNVIEQASISEENLAKTLDEIASDTENYAPEYHKVDVNEFYENASDVAPVILTSEEHGVFRVASEASVDVIEKEQNKEFTVKEVTPIIEKNLEQDSKGTVCDEITPALVAVGENGVVFVDSSSDVPAEHQIKELKQNAYTLDVSPANEQYEETTPIENVIEQASISEENLAKTLDEIASDTENDAPEYHKVDINEFDENENGLVCVNSSSFITRERHIRAHEQNSYTLDVSDKESSELLENTTLDEAAHEIIEENKELALLSKESIAKVLDDVAPNTETNTPESSIIDSAEQPSDFETVYHQIRYLDENLLLPMAAEEQSIIKHESEEKVLIIQTIEEQKAFLEETEKYTPTTIELEDPNLADQTSDLENFDNASLEVNFSETSEQPTLNDMSYDEFNNNVSLEPVKVVPIEEFNMEIQKCIRNLISSYGNEDEKVPLAETEQNEAITLKQLTPITVTMEERTPIYADLADNDNTSTKSDANKTSTTTFVDNSEAPDISDSKTEINVEKINLEHNETAVVEVEMKMNVIQDSDDDIPVLKGKVNRMISRLNSRDGTNLKTNKSEVDIPKTQSVLSKIAIFEQKSEAKPLRDIKPHFKPSIYIEVVDDSENYKPKIVNGVLKSTVDQNVPYVDYGKSDNESEDAVFEENNNTITGDSENVDDYESYIPDEKFEIIAHSDEYNEYSYDNDALIDNELKNKDFRVLDDNEVVFDTTSEFYDVRARNDFHRQSSTVENRIIKLKTGQSATNLHKAKSLAELDLGDTIKGKVHEILYHLSSRENLTHEKGEVINPKEMPRRKSVSEKIALFEGKLSSRTTQRTKTQHSVTRQKENVAHALDAELQRNIEELNKAKLNFGRTDNMTYLQLANGVKMPVIALGTALIDKQLTASVVAAAIDLGYRAIDTAFIYGNEKEVGEGIRRKLQDGTVTREELFITSKLWSTFHRPDLTERACKNSLEVMDLEYFDQYLIHNPMSFKEGGDPIPRIANVLQYSEHDYLDAWYGLERLVAKGLVKTIGVSNFNESQLQKVLDKARVKPVVNQVECHPYLAQAKMDAFCAERNVTLSCYGVLGSKGTPLSLKAFNSPIIDDPLVQVMAAGIGITPAQLLIRYQVQQGRAVVVKTTSAERLHENLQSLNVVLTDAQIDALSALNRNKRAYTFLGMGDTHKNYPFKASF